MKHYLLFISPETHNKNCLLWVFKTAITALNIKNVIVDDKKKLNYETIVLNEVSINSNLSKINLDIFSYSNTLVFNNKGLIISNEEEDELMTVFYLINSIQEYNSTSVDNIGRYKYENSYQKKYNMIESNFVTVLFEVYFKKYFPQLLNNRLFEKTQFFFSHDIDSLYGAFLQDGKAALKNGRFDIIAKLIFNAIILKPEWFNIDKILKIENQYDLKSTFFWIINKGRVNARLTNADYDINSVALKQTLQSILNNHSFIGLHKSISNETFNQELKKMPVQTTINRNHYLRLALPKHYQSIEESDLKIDCSLGFAEHYGFRNSLAIPFVPFNITEKKPYHFLEVPLNVMDGTFQKYMKLSPGETTQRVIDFIEKNKTNSVISVLWHNHFFNSYRFGGYFKPYEDILIYIKEQKFSFVNPETLFNKYYLA
jgi:peptidoglycan/xylan/chitin deacetylase (PgdA/CDA1 family)